MSTITIIVPTLNEAENVDLLLERILRVRQSSNLDFDILFVDSASADATCDRVLAWQDKAPVRLLRQEFDIGLAGAVTAGARYTDAEYVLVMDADLSHPPESIPKLLQPLLDGTFDMVIGSRYVEGGSLPDWPFLRRLSSRIATLPALLFCSVKDPLAGFFAVQRRRLTDLSDSVPGFKIGLAILAEYGRDIRVTEIPIEFRDRDYGYSKMNHRVALAYLKQLITLCFKCKAKGLTR
ncbi:polyprenol monophosphomannose synthase [Desulfopila sp. IMCC35006]|uniref:polyprenol monophosphomannose synthase n=1 Tax=Desulfopila sp. IMCC35006 TaxID=2569542 RepID=UPI00142EEB45|nr:polyprenol monophosphomannose synthase [Desulfopila sp. IMCC35006]